MSQQSCNKYRNDSIVSIDLNTIENKNFDLNIINTLFICESRVEM